MKTGTKLLLWYGGGVILVAGAYAVGFKRGVRRAELAQGGSIAPLPPAPTVTQVTVKAPSVVPLNLIPGAQAVNVPTGATLQVYPPDANSQLLTFSTASGSVTNVTSPAGPQAFTIRGSGTINVTWQDAQKNGQSSAIAVTAT